MFEVNENTFYTLPDINKGLGITIFTLRNWIKDGRLKARKTGVRYFIHGKALKDFLQTGTTDTPAKKTARKRKK